MARSAIKPISSKATVKKKKSRLNLFALLGPDLFLSIARLLRVEDILCLRQTCKRVASMTRERAVWSHLLLVRSKAAKIPPKIYPISQMSSIELETAVLAAFKMEAKLRSSNPDPKSTRLLTFRLKTDVGNSETSSGPSDFSVTALLVIPGGRYVVTLSVNRWLRCWDIRHSSETVVASWPLEHEMTELAVQMRSRDPLELVVAVWDHDVNDGYLSAQVFTLCLDDESPGARHFVCRCSLETSGLFESITLDGDMLLWMDGIEITVMNWETNEWGITSLGHPFVDHDDDISEFSDYSVTMMVMRTRSKTFLLIFQRTYRCIVYQQLEVPPLFSTPEAARSSPTSDPICSSVLRDHNLRFALQAPLWLPYTTHKVPNMHAQTSAILITPAKGKASLFGLRSFKERTVTSSRPRSSRLLFLPFELGTIGLSDSQWPTTTLTKLDVTTQGGLIAFWSNSSQELRARFLALEEHKSDIESDNGSSHGSEEGLEDDSDGESDEDLAEASELEEDSGEERSESLSADDNPSRTIVLGETMRDIRFLDSSVWSGVIFCSGPERADGSIRVLEFA